MNITKGNFIFYVYQYVIIQNPFSPEVSFGGRVNPVTVMEIPPGAEFE